MRHIYQLAINVSIHDETGLTGVVEHETPTGGAKPIFQLPRRVLFHKLADVENFVQGGLKKGVIRPSKSPSSIPLVMVRKKDGTKQFCVDFRRLNESTVGDSFPIPRIDNSLDVFGEAKLFTTLDLKGYWQVPVQEQIVRKLPLHVIKFVLIQHHALWSEGGSQDKMLPEVWTVEKRGK